jgi:hypothetical protein
MVQHLPCNYKKKKKRRRRKRRRKRITSNPECH